MAKKKKAKKSKSSLENLQMKPLMIAFVAGMFLGIQASGTGAMTAFIFGAAAGVGITASVYLMLDRKKRRKENQE